MTREADLRERLPSILPVVFTSEPVKRPEGIYWGPWEDIDISVAVHVDTVLAYAGQLSDDEWDLFIDAVSHLTLLVNELAGGLYFEINTDLVDQARTKLAEEAPEKAALLARLW